MGVPLRSRRNIGLASEDRILNAKAPATIRSKRTGCARMPNRKDKYIFSCALFLGADLSPPLQGNGRCLFLFARTSLLPAPRRLIDSSPRSRAEPAQHRVLEGFQRLQHPQQRCGPPRLVPGSHQDVLKVLLIASSSPRKPPLQAQDRPGLP